MTRPAPPALPDLSALTSHLVAHKGLHGPGVPENSLAAFEAAAAAGFAIECDVHLTLEGEVVVFHDHTLTRMCQRSEAVEALTRTNRKLSYLSATDQFIPTLGEVLEVVAGRVPVFVDLKPRHSWQALPKRLALRSARAVGEVLAGYSGPVGVMSWDPRQLRWFKEELPQVLRIQSGGVDTSLVLLPGLAGMFDELRWNRFSDPHAISFGASRLPRPSVLAARRSGRPVFAWTLRSEISLEAVLLHADNAIFEGFTPLATRPSSVPPPPEHHRLVRLAASLRGLRDGWRSMRRSERLATALALCGTLLLARGALVEGSLLSGHVSSGALLLASLLAAWHPGRWVLLGLVLAAASPALLLLAGAPLTASLAPLVALGGAFLGATLRALQEARR